MNGSLKGMLLRNEMNLTWDLLVMNYLFHKMSADIYAVYMRNETSR